MACCDHRVIDDFLRRSKVAMKTNMTTDRHIAQIDHSQLRNRALVRPVFHRMRAKPSGSGTMTTFATHAIVQFKGLRALSSRDSQRMASQTLRFLIGTTKL